MYVAIFVITLGLASTLPVIHASEDPTYIEVSTAQIKPTIDGKFTSESEWSDATVTNFQSNGNNFYLHTKHDVKFVYLMFNGVDFQTNPQNKDYSVRYQITACFDPNNDKNGKRQTGDFCYTSTEYNEFGQKVRGEGVPRKFDSEGDPSHLDLPGWAFNSVWGFGSQYDKLEQDDHLMHEVRIPKTLFHSTGDVGFTFEVYFDSAQGDDLVQLVNGVVWPMESNKEDVSSWGTLSLPLIHCKPDLELVFKVSTGEQACVKSDSKEKLIQRGWAKSSTTSSIDEPQPITDTPQITNESTKHDDFAFSFYHQIAEDDSTSNLFFSPFSISTAFSMVYEGVGGKTAEQIRDAFDFTQDDDARRKNISDTLQRLNHEKGFYELEVANGIWLAELHKPKPEYVEIVTTHYNGTSQTVDFVSNEGVDEINQWVSEKTKDKIQKILNYGDTNELTLLVLANSVYFNGKWGEQFNPDDTSEEPFWIGNEKSVKVQMMKIPAEMFNYAETDTIQILEMPYLGHDISMLVILPKDRNGLESLEKSLSSDKLVELKGVMEPQPLTVHIPKFKFEADYDLVPLLKKLGVHDAFDKVVADFSGMTDEKAFLSKAKHKAFVDVNEEGTEAAAVTVAIAELQSGPPDPRYQFKADHPFVFIIQEKDTGEILFIGRLANPSTS